MRHLDNPKVYAAAEKAFVSEISAISEIFQPYNVLVDVLDLKVNKNIAFAFQTLWLKNPDKNWEALIPGKN